jgi:hypothetical protein
VTDRNFGVFVIGDPPKIDSINICNIGGGELTFNNPNDPDVRALLEWLHDLFEVEESEIAKLLNAKLKGGECIWIKIKFTPGRIGHHYTVARFWGSVRNSRDTSVWTATVVAPGPQITGYDWEAQWVTPKPTGNCTKNRDSVYKSYVTVSNSGTMGFEVESIDLIGPDAPFFELESARSASVKPGDYFLPQGQQKQVVHFMPKEERAYSVIVRLITKGGDTVESILQGIGIESHGWITGATFDPTLACPPEQTRNVTITANLTRPLTIYTIQILGADAGCFQANLSGVLLPITLLPGESITIPVTFCGTSGQKCLAEIAFTGDHSLCDDSTGILNASISASVASGEALADLRLHHRMIGDDVEIGYTLAAPSRIRLEIFDARGGSVALLQDERSEAGASMARWNAAGYASGVYYCRVTVGKRSGTIPIVVAR